MQTHRHLSIILLLTGTAVMTAIFAVRAYAAARYHRTAAEDVLAQYVNLAAEEMVRRTTQHLGYYGFADAWRPLYEVAWPNLPEPAGDEQRLVRTYFRAEPAKGYLWSKGEHGPEHLRRNYLSQLADHPYPEGLPFILAFPDRPEPVVFRRTLRQDGTVRIEGIVIQTDRARTFIARALDDGPLMPVVRDGASVANQYLAISVAPEGGSAWFEQSVEETHISATAPFPAGFEALTATVAIPRVVAPSLIIGGLPSSQLPLLLGLFLLTLGLIAVAFVQFRRERLLALRQADSMAAISHELRTPLAQIRMFTETLLLGRVRSAEEQNRSLQIIDQETRRLSDLVDNVILFSSALHGRSSAALAPVSIEPLFQETRRFFLEHTRAKNMRISLETSPDTVVLADERLLRRILHNLVDNAVKYGAGGQEIRLVTEPVDGKVEMFVEDQGEGIAESEYERIWNRFERLPRHQANAGTGIGLWLVRELAFAQSADVFVTRAESGGARFGLIFPRPLEVDQ